MSDFECIYSYTRAQAIEDGVLVDLTPWARRAGFKYPLACTAGVWAAVLSGDDTPTDVFTRNLGLFLADLRDHARNTDGDRFEFSWLSRTEPNEHVDLYCVCGPGDTAEPVLTVMLQGED